MPIPHPRALCAQRAHDGARGEAQPFADGREGLAGLTETGGSLDIRCGAVQLCPQERSRDPEVGGDGFTRLTGGAAADGIGQTVAGQGSGAARVGRAVVVVQPTRIAVDGGRLCPASWVSARLRLVVL
jgi:hypothetical protein